MKIRISVCRKVGMPNFGSEGASCEIELEMPEAGPSENPAAVAAEIRRAYAMAEAVVAEQLARHQVVPQPPPAAAAPAPARRPAVPLGPNPSRAGSAAYQPHNGKPRNGKQLYPWARRLEESGHYPGLIAALEQIGRAAGFPGRLTDWSAAQVAEALAELAPESVAN